jgi:hypothetical protein
MAKLLIHIHTGAENPTKAALGMGQWHIADRGRLAFDRRSSMRRQTLACIPTIKP